MLYHRHWAKQLIRNFFNKQGFIEIDSPILVENFTEEFISPIFSNINKELRTSPEVYLKKILSFNYDKIYEIGHVFRQESEDNLHQIEFSMIEWYRTNSNLNHLIKDCENLFFLLAPSIFSTSFEKQSLNSLWKNILNIDLESALEKNNFMDVIHKKLNFSLKGTFYDSFSHIMTTIIEPQIGLKKPCVVLDWPQQLACFAQLKSLSPLWANRFEIYFQGIELANAFFELTNPIDQEKRILTDKHKTKTSLSINMPLKNLSSLKSVAGISLGIDRLLMILLGLENIKHSM